MFNSGTGYHNPVALSLGLNYTPVPLVTVTAQHKQGESGENQNNLGLNLNYRFGVPLKKQLSAGEVAESQSLRVVAMTIRSEIIYRLLSTDSEKR
ncbi:invasin [Escherichia coli]|uniref:Invasin n=1 Tax=Escherichia coli TaxID=562 RepID=A0A376TGR1_ECOLX|nr:invasin [Escherichia coli]